jgi:hypothetical protein
MDTDLQVTLGNIAPIDSATDAGDVALDEAARRTSETADDSAVRDPEPCSGIEAIERRDAAETDFATD